MEGRENERERERRKGRAKREDEGNMGGGAGEASLRECLVRTCVRAWVHACDRCGSERGQAEERELPKDKGWKGGPDSDGREGKGRQEGEESETGELGLGQVRNPPARNALVNDDPLTVRNRRAAGEGVWLAGWAS